MTDETPDFGFADDAHRYRLDSRIATGGMGEVWRGTDTVLGRQVAVKLLKAEYADNASFRSRFETEARHAASLHHPGVAAVYDFGEANATDGSGVQRPFLIMELVDGQPLSALLTPGQPLDPDATRDLLAQAADALGVAHAAGIVHRDVKPANLLVTPDRQVKITDFGIARAAEGIALTETGQVMGTPQYLSPEQAEGRTATPASDVYSLGVVAYECLAGRRPFVAETAIATALAHLREPVPDLPGDVPADLAAVVRRALSKSPAERFPDATAFAAALRDPATAATAVVPPASDTTQVIGGAAVAAPPTPVSTPAAAPAASTTDDTRRRRLAPWLILLGGLLLVGVVVFAVMAGAGDGDDPTDQPTQDSSPSGQTRSPSGGASSGSAPAPSDSGSATKPSTPRSSKASESATPSESASASDSPTPTPTTEEASPSAPASSAPASETTTSAPASPAAASSSPSTAPSTAPSFQPSSATSNRPSPSTSGEAATR